MKWFRSFLSVFDARDVLFAGGMASLCYGVSLIYPPAAWIVGGVVTVVISLRGAS